MSDDFRYPAPAISMGYTAGLLPEDQDERNAKKVSMAELKIEIDKIEKAAREKWELENKVFQSPKKESQLDETSLKATIERQEKFYAKEQLADFTKAAMHGLCASPVNLSLDDIAEFACKIARDTIDEMIRREKEDD